MKLALFAATASCAQSEVPATQLLVTVSAPDPEVAGSIKLVVASMYHHDATDQDAPTEQMRFAVASGTPGAGEFAFPFSFGVVRGKEERFKLVVEGYDDPRGAPTIEQKSFASFQPAQELPIFVALTRGCHRSALPCSGLGQTCAPRDQETQRAGTCGPVPVAVSTQPSDETTRAGGIVDLDAGVRGTGSDNAVSRGAPEAGAAAEGGTSRGVVEDPCVDPSSLNCEYLRGCEAGKASACYSAGLAFQTGLFVRRDPMRALALLSRACDGGELVACRVVGTMYEEGDGIPVDEPRALTFYQRACDGGHMRGCVFAGLMFRAATVATPRDNARALAFFQRACSGNDMYGCYHVGVSYQYGYGVPLDHAQARALYERACTGGESAGCVDLGLMCLNGVGGAVDYPRALQLFTQGCDDDEPVGCNDVGWMYENGFGVPKDDARALALYQEACRRGNDRGCTNAKNLAH